MVIDHRRVPKADISRFLPTDFSYSVQIGLIPTPLVDSYLSKHSVMIKAPVDRWAKFPHSPILHYAYSLLLEENNSANNRLPLGLSALFSRS